MKISLSILLVLTPTLFIPDTSHALNSRDISRLNSYTTQVISLGRLIESYPKSPLGDRIILQRKAILDRARELSGTLIFGYSPIPTFDISSKYHFLIQKYKLSCESAATSMVIESLTGIPTTEDTIFSSWRNMPEPYGSGAIWWDPDIGFVGSLTGSQFLRTGYGIYEKPIEKYLRWLGFTAISSNSMDTRTLTSPARLNENIEAIEAWDRVILWGDWCTRPEYDDGITDKVDTFVATNFPLSAKNQCDRVEEKRKFTWKTEGGKVVHWLSGEHVFLLLGYGGEREKPSHIVVWDTDTGRHVFPYNEWMRKWKLMQYRSLIVSIE